jgi:thioredoxin 1
MIGVFMINKRLLSAIFSIAMISSCVEIAANVISVTDNNFESVVLKAERPVIIDFKAKWCGPCKKYEPIFEEMAKEYGHSYIFVSIDIDEAQKTAITYKISAVPTVIIMEKGIVRGTSQEFGIINKENFTQKVEECLKADIAKGPISNAPAIPQEMMFLSALASGDINLVKQMIQQGVDVNYIFKLPMPLGEHKGKEMQMTSLSFALSSGNKELVKVLLDAGANPALKYEDIKGKKVTALDQVKQAVDDAQKNYQEMKAFVEGYQKNNSKR